AVRKANMLDAWGQITAYDVDLDGDGIADRIYQVNAGTAFEPGSEGMLTNEVFDGLVVRWSRGGKPTVAHRSSRYISFNRAVDLGDGRLALVVSETARYALFEASMGTLRRVGRGRCVL